MLNVSLARVRFSYHIYAVNFLFNKHMLSCIGAWSLMGYIKDSDVKAVAVLSEVDRDGEEELEDN
jgi:hypothetical protein